MVVVVSSFVSRLCFAVVMLSLTTSAAEECLDRQGVEYLACLVAANSEDDKLCLTEPSSILVPTPQVCWAVGGYHHSFFATTTTSSTSHALGCCPRSRVPAIRDRLKDHSSCHLAPTWLSFLANQTAEVCGDGRGFAMALNQQEIYCCFLPDMDDPLSTASPISAPLNTHRPSTHNPTNEPTFEPTIRPTQGPASQPTFGPTNEPTTVPTNEPTTAPALSPASVCPGTQKYCWWDDTCVDDLDSCPCFTGNQEFILEQCANLYGSDNCCNLGSDSCRFGDSIVTICPGSCQGQDACVYVGGRNQGFSVGYNSCKGESEACFEAWGTIGNDSCIGNSACHGALFIGNGSCNEDMACRYARHVSTSSCNALFACPGGHRVGPQSCNARQACNLAYDIGGYSCNAQFACFESFQIGVCSCNKFEGACDSTAFVGDFVFDGVIDNSDGSTNEPEIRVEALVKTCWDGSKVGYFAACPCIRGDLEFVLENCSKPNSDCCSHGRESCEFEDIATICPGSCNGNKACVAEFGFGTFSVGLSSCNGESACVGANGKVGDRSCSGDRACSYVKEAEVCESIDNCFAVGPDSCNDRVACTGARGIGPSSCNGDEACWGARNIGSCSCNGRNNCISASNIGTFSCNGGNGLCYFDTDIGDNMQNDDSHDNETIGSPFVAEITECGFVVGTDVEGPPEDPSSDN